MKSSRNRHRKNRRQQKNRLTIERLEARQLLAGDTIVMFNDHARGSGTHENATSYAPNGVQSGLLKDIDTGEETAITLTTSAVGVTYELLTLNPNEGTDAHDIFDGFVHMLLGSGAGIKLPDGASFTHRFSGLDPNSTYEFIGTGVRGDAAAVDRWTHVTLSGADGFTVDHSTGTGVITDGLPDEEVALWTGGNRSEGRVLRWSNIRPGADGEFSIVSQKYAGPTPGFGSGDSSGGANGYGLEAIRFTEFKPNLKVISSSINDGDVLPAPPTTVTMDFSSDIDAATIDAGDLLIDGAPATNVTIVDADTLVWDLPPNLSPGDHTLSISAGVMTNVPLGIEVQPFDATFAVLGAPSVANDAPTNITPISAEIGGTVTNDGGDNPELLVYWGDNDGGTEPAAWDQVISFGTHGTDSGSTRTIESLLELTTYYYRAFARNSAGEGWASETASFTTPEVQPAAIAVSAATSVTAGSARINGIVSETGGEPPIVTVVYGLSDAGNDANAWDNTLDIGRRDSSFSQFISGLDPQTQYFYSAFAENTAGIVWASNTLSLTTPEATPQRIVINELHVDPDVKTEPVEFVELYNAGDIDTDLSGWALTDAVDFTFPEGTVLAAGDYVVVAQDPSALQTKYGVTSLGPYVGQLNNDGERVVLRDALTDAQDVVDYQLGFPWPTVGDEPGYSMELIHPSLDNDLAGSWRSSSGSTDSAQTFVPQSSQWRYFKGTQEPSAAVGAWREIAFDDGDWLVGTASIGYGDGHVTTNVSDMENNFTSLYLRKEFTVGDASAIDALLFTAQYDDGINVWINGTNVVSDNVPGENLPYTATANGSNEVIDFREFQILNAQDFLVDGTNVIAVQLLNRASNSSDAWFDGTLTQSFGGQSGVTPGRQNSVFATNAAPQIRQVDHRPKSPVSGEEVVVTAKVTDPDGVASVQLEYQLVEPGDYISDSDARYAEGWTALVMTDDGFGGDEVAGDEVFSVTMPTELQTHRRLVRYRITVADTTDLSVRVPYADDPTPNFAYFVYDGVPDWTGSARPGVAPEVTYSGELLESVPTYHFLTTEESQADAMFVPDSSRGSGYTGSDYLWEGTLVYDGEVYDHIRFRARGGVWRYAMGKNMYKFDFNRGQAFQAHDDYGRAYDTKWDKLNFSALIQQGNFDHRGEQGLFESVGFKMFNLVDLESPYTHFVSFRLITDADEFGEDQFSGDFQGLYMAIEQPDGRMLDEHGLPDGNFYKMESGTGELNNQGPTQPTDKSDLNAFLSQSNSTSNPEQWWRDNLDLERYYSYRAIVEGIHHYDIANGKNYFYYNNPETGQWQVHPWDLDLTWANNMFGSGNEPFKSRVADRTEFRAEYRNRMREVRDLLYNTDQGYQLIDEMARIIHTPGEPSLVDADRAMWDYNPILTSSYVNPSKAGHGRFYQQASTKDFPGMANILKNYIVSRGNYIDTTILDDDASIPDQPQLTYEGPADFALNQLHFSTSAISGGVGEFAAMKWRIAEITDPNNPAYDPTAPVNYEITATWESDEITTFDSQMTIPATNLNEGDSYRVRVRLKNSEGYWSHWSDPVQFIAGPATNTDLLDHLRISEIMYNPSDPTVTEISAGFTDNNSFEWVELVNNSSDTTLDLSGVAFTDGIEFTFAAGTSLDPGQRVLVVRDADAFAHRHGAELNVAGEFASGGLNNNGERIRVEGPTAGEILDFSYSDGDLWPQAADGVGASLELVNAAGGADSLGKFYQWRSSASFGGSPGTVGEESPGVVINEVLSHTDPPVDRSDSIELYNTSGNDIDIGGWFLSDSQNDLLKFEVPAGTILGPGEFLVFDESDFNPTPMDPGEDDFALSSANGDDVWLVIPDGDGGVATFVDDMNFGPALNGQSLGRIPAGTGHLVPLGRNSLGCAATQPHLSEVVITEVHYNPSEPSNAALAVYADLVASDLEFIEIHNPGTAVAVDLTDWRLRGGADYDFEAELSLGTNETLVVVSFDPIDPDNADRLDAFRTHYGLDALVEIVGGWAGQLGNGGEAVRLEQPDQPPIEDPMNTPHAVSDIVIYDDVGIWPTSADGLGDSLQRKSPVFFANDAGSWFAAVPTPGSVAFEPIAGDMSGDGLVDIDDVNLLATGIHSGLTTTELDIDQNGQFNTEDIYALVQTIGGLPGDANLSADVTAADLNQVGLHWLQSNCVGWNQGEFTGDGEVNAADLNVLGIHWLQAAGNRVARAPRAPLAGAAVVSPSESYLEHDTTVVVEPAGTVDTGILPDESFYATSRVFSSRSVERRSFGESARSDRSFERLTDELMAEW